MQTLGHHRVYSTVKRFLFEGVGVGKTVSEVLHATHALTANRTRDFYDDSLDGMRERGFIQYLPDLLLRGLCVAQSVRAPRVEIDHDVLVGRNFPDHGK